MDFGEILEKWEKQNTRDKGKNSAPAGDRYSGSGSNDDISALSPHPLNVWLDRNGIYDKDSALSGERNINGERRHKLLRKKPDAVIDLHGLGVDEAWTALEAFFQNSRELGHEKLLVIHGKGNHRNTATRDFISARLYDNRYDGGNNGVLRDLTRRFIERCSFAGESGHSTAREGGTGSTWVILKEKEGERG